MRPPDKMRESEADRLEQTGISVWPRENLEVPSHDEVKREIAKCQRDGLTIRLLSTWDGYLR